MRADATKPTLGHVIAAHLVLRFRNGTTRAGVPFDDLVGEVEAQLTDELRQTMRMFGTSVERAIAWAIAPLVEVGEALWENSSRRVWISRVGVQLLAADANYTRCENNPPAYHQSTERKRVRQPLGSRSQPQVLRG